MGLRGAFMGQNESFDWGSNKSDAFLYILVPYVSLLEVATGE